MNPEVPEGLHWADAEIVRKVLLADNIGRQYLKSIREFLKDHDVVLTQMDAVQRKLDAHLRRIDADWMAKLKGAKLTRSSQVTAILVGTSPATVERARRVLRKASDFTRMKLENGQMTIQDAIRQAATDDQDQRTIDIAPRPFDSSLLLQERVLEAIRAICGPREVIAFRHLRARDVSELRGMVKVITALEKIQSLTDSQARVAKRAARQLAVKEGWEPI